MKIVIDSAIPYIKGVFEPFAQVTYCLGSEITPEIVVDADAMIIRTRTKCNKEMLRGSSVRHIATATIGFDHIDLDYCAQHNITVTSAAGCNARAVLHWVGTALAHLSQLKGWQPCEKTIGVVGVGNVGSLIKEYALEWGFRVVCCDPPRALREGGGDFLSLEEVAKRADILTLHTPLNDSTFHFIDKTILELLPSGATVINTSRGEVIPTEDLLVSDVDYALDVWEDEPNINSKLLQRSLLSTYHIAGYSKQGKANGSAIVVRDIANHFSLPIKDWYPDVEQITPRKISWSELTASILDHMDIVKESQTLKNHREDFESLRNNYNYRDEKF
ncbi:MAG: 4-phosphoerythronate dehydrogenase [Rikenellaceae bacterium]